MTITDDSPSARTNGPVHEWFELTYSSYQVVPRVLAQSMPVEWQDKFVTCLRELSESFQHVEQADSYRVDPGRWIYVDELTKQQRKVAGITAAADEHLAALDPDAEDHNEQYDAICDEWGEVFYDDRGNELRSPERVFVPGTDPLPGYRHSYIAPQIPA